MIKDFDVRKFPINGSDFDEYCLSFYEQYGENSDVFRSVDEIYFQIEQIHGGLWIDHLNTLRRALCERGFEREVLAQDEIAAKEWDKRLSENCKGFKGTLRDAILKRGKEL